MSYQVALADDPADSAIANEQLNRPPWQDDARAIRLLTFSTLYPSSNRPEHGIFVETRLRHLLLSGSVQSRVIAPVPWFPAKHRWFGQYGKLSNVPLHEVHNGVHVHHPRYLLLPKIGMTSAPFTLGRAGLAAARRLMTDGYDFDVIDAHYFYPDGIAAIRLGRALGKPVVITARGSDINLIPQYGLPRRMILQAAQECAAMITVCAALKDKLIKLGAKSNKITVLRNGVDLKLFYPEERAPARSAFCMSRFALASVGHLVEQKGHDLVIGALRQLTDAELFIAGSGPEERRLRALAANWGVADRVRFLGTMPQQRLRTLYSGVDALVLASSSEGWPNVLLESMACGTQVLAQDVGGVPEVVAAPDAGLLVRERSAAAIVAGVNQLQSSAPERSATRRYAEQFSWDEITRQQVVLFKLLSAQAGSLRG